MMPWDRDWRDEMPDLEAKDRPPCPYCDGYGTVWIDRRGMCDPDITEIVCEDCDGTGERHG